MACFSPLTAKLACVDKVKSIHLYCKLQKLDEMELNNDFAEKHPCLSSVWMRGVNDSISIQWIRAHSHCGRMELYSLFSAHRTGSVFQAVYI